MHSMILGLLHPFHGGDHLLAMLAVGFWGARYPGSLRWLLPASFVGGTAAGAFLWAPLPYVEPMIALSVLVIGLAVAMRARLPAAAGAAVVFAFAVFHGHAHIEELAAGVSASLFMSGLLATTAVLHVAGVYVALGVGRVSAALPRALGAATALAGAWLLLA